MRAQHRHADLTSAHQSHHLRFLFQNPSTGNTDDIIFIIPKVSTQSVSKYMGILHYNYTYLYLYSVLELPSLRNVSKQNQYSLPMCHFLSH